MSGTGTGAVSMSVGFPGEDPGPVVSEPDFPEDSWVQVRYPLTSEQEHGDRDAWPWLPGWVVGKCGPDEWQVCVQAPELGVQDQGQTVYPVCFRDSSEIRRPEAEPEARAMRTADVPGAGVSGSLCVRGEVPEPRDPGYPAPGRPGSDLGAPAINRATAEIRADGETGPEPGAGR